MTWWQPRYFCTIPNSRPKSLFCVDCNGSRYLKWAYVRLTVIDRVCLSLMLTNALLLRGFMNSREWRSEVWYGSLSMITFDEVQYSRRCIKACIIDHFIWRIQWKLLPTSFWSAVYAGSLHSSIVKVIFSICNEVNRMAIHFNEIDIIWRMRW